MKKSHIIPFPYIDCKEKNELYEQMDAILTKPGELQQAKAFLNESLFLSMMLCPARRNQSEAVKGFRLGLLPKQVRSSRTIIFHSAKPK